MSDEHQLLTILQLSDTAFPTGGFSHSVGFEAASKHRLVTDTESFEKFIIASLENAGSQMLPFVREAHNHHDDLTALETLDSACESCLYNHVANRASTRQGRSLVNTASLTFTESPQVAALQHNVRERRIHAHFAVMFGCVCASLGVGLHSCLSMFMYTTLKTIAASAVKLGAFGALQTQAVQHRMQKIIPDIITRSGVLSVQDVHVKFPMVDIVQNVQDSMFSKLFYS